MKYLLIIPFIFLSNILIAQVPPGTLNPRDVGVDIVIPAQGKTTGKQVSSYYQKDGKYGFIDSQGNQQPAIYNKIGFSSGGFILQKDGFYGIADKQGQVIGNIGYDSVGTAYQNTYIIKKKGKYGTILPDGNKILSIKYDRILYSNNVVSFTQSLNGEIQMIFNEQEKAFPSKIEYAAIYANLVVIKANGKFGVVKKQLAIPLSYDSIFVVNAEANSIMARNKPVVKRYSPIDKSNIFKTVTFLTLQKDNKYGMADSDGGIIFPVDNDAVYENELLRYCTVKKGKLYGIYFINGKKKTAIEFDKVYADGIGFVMASKNQKSGAFDLQGKQIVPFEYDPDFISQYSIGLGIKKNRKKGIIGKDGTMLIPPIYDDVNPFYESGLEGLVKVKLGDKYGIVTIKGKTIIPVLFNWIGEEKGFLKVSTADEKVGLYDKSGKVVIPAEYLWIMDSDNENSNLIVLKRQDNTYNFLNKNTKQVLLKENVSDYGYIIDQNGLLNPFASGNKQLLFVKGKNGRLGLLNEVTGLLDVPVAYDDIMQFFDGGKNAYFTVRNGKKYGLIDGKNKQVIPLQYDAISIDIADRLSDSYSVVVAKGKKFGTVSLENKQKIPFQYDDLQCVLYNGLYKARVGDHFQLINAKNEIINKGPFDEVANFEGSRESGWQALTFYKGKMRVINEKGKFISAEVAMQPHQGYKTFDELKWALIKALDSKDDDLLKDFAAKIAPSAHILFYLKENLFTRQSLQYTNIDGVKEKYYNDLLKFKLSKWNQKQGYSYNRASLTNVTDYTLYRDDLVTNTRTSDQDFGDSRFMEKLLRNAIKINGYWISTYFMNPRIDRY